MRNDDLGREHAETERWTRGVSLLPPAPICAYVRRPVQSESIEVSLNWDNKSREEEETRPLGAKGQPLCMPSAKAAPPSSMPRLASRL